jgi:5'-methylthioadenosine phosphorylase
MPRIAVIGGSGLEGLLAEKLRLVRIGTPYGPAPPISIGRTGREEIAFLSRHGPKHDLPPHRVNYRGNLYALKQLGVERIIATNAVGCINSQYAPGELAIPEDIIDLTKSRESTFFDRDPVTHVDMSQPYCPELRKALIDSARDQKTKTWSNSIMAATQGPRYETPAEIRMLSALGGDIVGMTGAPEVFLARELQMCYSTLCFISNRAAGKQEKLSAVEVMEVGKRMAPQILKILHQTISNTPIERRCACRWSKDEAQV